MAVRKIFLYLIILKLSDSDSWFLWRSERGSSTAIVFFRPVRQDFYSCS